MFIHNLHTIGRERPVHLTLTQYPPLALTGFAERIACQNDPLSNCLPICPYYAEAWLQYLIALGLATGAGPNTCQCLVNTINTTCDAAPNKALTVNKVAGNALASSAAATEQNLGHGKRSLVEVIAHFTYVRKPSICSGLAAVSAAHNSMYIYSTHSATKNQHVTRNLNSLHGRLINIVHLLVAQTLNCVLKQGDLLLLDATNTWATLCTAPVLCMPYTGQFYCR